MDKVKAFFRTAYLELRANFVSVVKEFPFSVGAIFLLGLGLGLML